MKLFLKINSVEGGKIEILTYIKPADDYVLVRKHIFMRIDLTPFTYEVSKDFFVIYAKGLGEFTLDQNEDAENTIKVLEVDSVEVTDNSDLYDKLKVL
jgi:hypothetical protein